MTTTIDTLTRADRPCPADPSLTFARSCRSSAGQAVTPRTIGVVVADRDGYRYQLTTDVERIVTAGTVIGGAVAGGRADRGGPARAEGAADHYGAGRLGQLPRRGGTPGARRAPAVVGRVAAGSPGPARIRRDALAAHLEAAAEAEPRR